MTPSYHIIIAAHDATIRALLARVVAHIYLSATVSALADGLEALRLYEQRGANLLVITNDMPRLGGLALVRRLRARQVTVPIVMISAVPISAQQALAAGVTQFLKMPFSLPELTQALTSLLPP